MNLLSKIFSLFLLSRPFSDDEKRCRAPQVISCNESRREVTVLQNIARNQIDRTFTFDKVSSQRGIRLLVYVSGKMTEEE